MKIDQKKKRLNAIKLKYVIFPRYCICCGEEYVREKIWIVHRYSGHPSGYFSTEYCYCQNCMHSKEDILNDIYTDSIPYGIYRVDPPYGYKKDFYTVENV